MCPISETKMIMLMDVVKSINSNLAADDMLKQIISEARSITGSESSSLILAEEGTRDLYFMISTDDKEQILKMIRIPAGKGIAGIVAETGQGMIVNDADKDDRIFKEVDNATSITTRNLICVPLVLKNRVLGVLEVINKKKGFYITDDMDLLKFFADFAALAINHRELYKKATRKALETEALYRLAESINIQDSIRSLLESNINIVYETLNASTASLILKEGALFEVKFSAGTDAKLKRQIPYELILEHVLKMERGIFCPNVGEDDRFIKIKDDISFMVAPLKLRSSIFGFICATSRKGESPYCYSDFHLLEMLAQQIADNFNYFKLWDEYKEKQKIETELAFTAQMQKEILPKVFPDPDSFDIAARALPARLVGGDFYDFIPLEDGKYLVIIADVSGKGMTACMFMAISRSILRAQLEHVKDPAQILESANRRIFEDSIYGMFVTCFCCVLDVKKREITYSNAGHLEQFLFRKGNHDRVNLHTVGKPLGVVKNSAYTAKTIGYSEGDLLFLFTDGLTETMNKNYEEYGADRLIAALKKAQNSPNCDALSDMVLEENKRFQGGTELFDDITLMAIRFK